MYLYLEYKMQCILSMGGEEHFTLEREELLPRVLRLNINEIEKKVNF